MYSHARNNVPISRVQTVPIVVTILAIAGSAICIVAAPVVREYLDDEVFKLTYQFLLIVVLGAGVSASFQAISFAREARERRRAFQREVHDGLVTGYNDAKRARRLLRARARVNIDPETSARYDILFKQYDRQLEALSGAQLSIEFAIRRIEVNRLLFYHADDIVASLKVVEKYLNEVIDEWEETGPKAKTLGPVKLTSAELPNLEDFLRHYHPAARFPSHFKEPFKKALRLIEGDISATSQETLQ